jgi:probable rRNA maturation factor
MSLDVDVASSGVRVAISRARTAEIARATLASERVRHALISITFLDSRAIAALNRRHLGRRGATDVISFGFAPAARRGPVIGDIYIAPTVAAAHARANATPVREELTRLVVHGVLHVLGYDHPEDDGREDSDMWRRQERLVRRLTSGRPR